MATWRPRIVRALWRRASWLDRVATALVALYLAIRVAEAFGWQPAAGPASLAVLLVSLLFFAAVVFLLIRSRHWVASRLLWKLRNRLIFAYIFIAAVPVVLLVAIGLIVGYLAEVEVAGHLLHDHVRDRMEQLAAVSHEALALAQVVAGPKTSLDSLPGSAPIRTLQQSDPNSLPGLAVKFLPATPATAAPTSDTGPARIVEQGSQLWIEAASVGELPGARWVEARARIPVTPSFLDGLSPELGPLTLQAPRVTPREPSPQSRGDREPRTGAGVPPAAPQPALPLTQHYNFEFPGAFSVSTRHRFVAPAKHWFDFLIVGFTTFDAWEIPQAEARPVPAPLLATFSLRASSLGGRITGSLGEFSVVPTVLLALAVGLALILWLLAFVAGMVLTRTITQTVAKLDEATHHVKAGDFSHRILIERRDQLGALGESFNGMTASIEGLLEEQRQRQRLENELAIAREVQAELFPRSLPEMPGLELGAICRAARVVSGDYYDCLELGPQRVAIALADISGKGISAALLMASLNAALRSLVAADGGAAFDTAALAERLNRHLLLNTSDDRYATFFFAVYDAAARRLDYTNAGHLPPFFISGDRIERLDRGGPVIGLLDRCSYEQASLEVAPGSLLVAYSDGITEPENAYGEEFGADRLVAEILRHRHQRPAELCTTLVDAVTSWCAPAEPFDDQTVVAARMP